MGEAALAFNDLRLITLQMVITFGIQGSAGNCACVVYCADETDVLRCVG